MDKKVNLSDLTKVLALTLGLDPKTTKDVLDGFLEVVKEKLCKGVPVNLSGFGSFKIQHRKARRVRNPRIAHGPGAFKEVEAKTVYRFRPGIGLKQSA